jgi:anti-sigma B factor antagonist
MEKPDLGIAVDETRPPFTVVAVTGEIDVSTSPQLREKILELLEQQKRRLVIDLEGTAFLDSTGLGVLVGASKRLRAAGGSLTVVCSQPRILRTLKLTNLDRVFNVRTSLDAGTSN